MSRMTDYCDIACDQCHQWEPGVEAGTKDQRKILAEQGWTLRHGEDKRLQDICPVCNKSNPHYWGRVRTLKGSER